MTRLWRGRRIITEFERINGVSSCCFFFFYYYVYYHYYYSFGFFFVFFLLSVSHLRVRPRLRLLAFRERHTNSYVHVWPRRTARVNTHRRRPHRTEFHVYHRYDVLYSIQSARTCNLFPLSIQMAAYGPSSEKNH